MGAVCWSEVPFFALAPPEKLTHADVKRIQCRVRAGERQTDLAREYGVNRKTIRRRLGELEEVEAMAAERVAASRLRRQAAREKRKLFEREQAVGFLSEVNPPSRRPAASRPVHGVDPHYPEWLERPRNMTSRAAAAASGLTRIETRIRRSAPGSSVTRLRLVSTLAGSSTSDSLRAAALRRLVTLGRVQCSPDSARARISSSGQAQH